MRAFLALVASTLALSSVAGVAAAQDDRYDPPRSGAAGNGQAVADAHVAAAGDKGPLLSWSGKTPPTVAAPQSVQATLAPARFTPPPAAPPSAQGAPPAAPPAPRADASAGPGVRFYSLHRDFGLTPDPDPTPPDHAMVLVGPPNGAQADGGVADDIDSGKAGQHGGASDSETE